MGSTLIWQKFAPIWADVMLHTLHLVLIQFNLIFSMKFGSLRKLAVKPQLRWRVGRGRKNVLILCEFIHTKKRVIIMRASVLEWEGTIATIPHP